MPILFARIAFPLVMLWAVLSSVVAQPIDPLFLRVENAVRRKEPDWNLINRWLAPTGQSIGFRWRSDQQEIAAFIIFEPTIADAITLFQDDGLGPLLAKTERQPLDIGDGCYLRQSGRVTAVVLRKDNILVRLGSDSSEPQLLARFAYHIGRVLQPVDSTDSETANNKREDSSPKVRRH